MCIAAAWKFDFFCFQIIAHCLGEQKTYGSPTKFPSKDSLTLTMFFGDFLRYMNYFWMQFLWNVNLRWDLHSEPSICPLWWINKISLILENFQKYIVLFCTHDCTLHEMTTKCYLDYIAVEAVVWLSKTLFFRSKHCSLKPIPRRRRRLWPIRNKRCSSCPSSN